VKKVARRRVAKNCFQPSEFPSWWKKFFTFTLKGSCGLTRIVRSHHAQQNNIHNFKNTINYGNMICFSSFNDSKGQATLKINSFIKKMTKD